LRSTAALSKEIRAIWSIYQVRWT